MVRFGFASFGLVRFIGSELNRSITTFDCVQRLRTKDKRNPIVLPSLRVPANLSRQQYNAVDLDGIAAPSIALHNGDVIVNKQSPDNATEHTFGGSEATVNYRPSPLTYKSPMHG